MWHNYFTDLMAIKWESQVFKQVEPPDKQYRGGLGGGDREVLGAEAAC